MLLLLLFFPDIIRITSAGYCFHHSSSSSTTRISLSSTTPKLLGPPTAFNRVNSNTHRTCIKRLPIVPSLSLSSSSNDDDDGTQLVHPSLNQHNDITTTTNNNNNKNNKNNINENDNENSNKDEELQIVEPLLEQAWQSFVQDLESLPSPRVRRRYDLPPATTTTTTTDNNDNNTVSSSLHSSVRLKTTTIPSSSSNTWSTIDTDSLRLVRGLVLSAFRESPAFRSLYASRRSIDPTDDECGADAGAGADGPLGRLVSVVGPIAKLRLVEMVVRHPHLMADVLRSYDCLKSTKTIIAETLNLSPTETDKLIARIPPKAKKTPKQPRTTAPPTPPFLQKTNRHDLQQTFHYLLQPPLSIPLPTLRKIYTSNPQLFTYSRTKIQTTVDYFLIDLELDAGDVGKMIRTSPLVVAHGLEGKIVPVVEVLRGGVLDDDGGGLTNNGLGLGGVSWRKIVVRYPQVFSKAVDSFVPKAHLLQQILKLQKRSDVSFVISGFPPLLWLSEDNICSKVDFLQTELKLDDDELRDMVMTYPQILGLSIDNNLRPKVHFLLTPVVEPYEQHQMPQSLSPKVLNTTISNYSAGAETNSDPDSLSLSGGAGLTREELKDFMMYQPALIAYSLDARIRPRIQRLQENNIRFCYAPPYLMSLPDDKFNSWLNQQTSSWSVR